MSREQVYQCDVCRTAKLQTNHWFLVTSTKTGLALRNWSDSAARAAGVKHLCGSTCALRCVGQWAEEETARTKEITGQSVV